MTKHGLRHCRDRDPLPTAADVRLVAKHGWIRDHCDMVLALLLCLLAGCDRLDMYDQPRYEPLEASRFFSDGLSARQPVEGTIARGQLREDVPFYTGKDGAQFVRQIPDAAYAAVYERDPQRFNQPFDQIEPSRLRQALFERGRERFDIYCSVCHGRTGDGDGMIVRRGFRRPPSYHLDRLRQSSSGYFYDVITNGFGAMTSYANRIDAGDRWAIVAYLRALQISQHASLDDVPEEQRHQLMTQPFADSQTDEPREHTP